MQGLTITSGRGRGRGRGRGGRKGRASRDGQVKGGGTRSLSYAKRAKCLDLDTRSFVTLYYLLFNKLPPHFAKQW